MTKCPECNANDMISHAELKNDCRMWHNTESHDKCTYNVCRATAEDDAVFADARHLYLANQPAGPSSPATAPSEPAGAMHGGTRWLGGGAGGVGLPRNVTL